MERWLLLCENHRGFSVPPQYLRSYRGSNWRLPATLLSTILIAYPTLKHSCPTGPRPAPLVRAPDRDPTEVVQQTLLEAHGKGTNCGARTDSQRAAPLQPNHVLAHGCAPAARTPQPGCGRTVRGRGGSTTSVHRCRWSVRRP